MNKDRHTALSELLEYPSSQHCVCGYCGGQAHYHGKPEDINRAAREFYEIHKHPEKKNGASPKEGV